MTDDNRRTPDANNNMEDNGWTPMDYESPLIERPRKARVSLQISPVSVADLDDIPSSPELKYAVHKPDLEKEVKKCYTNDNRKYPLKSFEKFGSEINNKVIFYETWSQIVFGSEEQAKAAEESLRVQLKELLTLPLQPPPLKNIKVLSSREERPRRQDKIVLMLRENQQNEMLPIANANNVAGQNGLRPTHWNADVAAFVPHRQQSQNHGQVAVNAPRAVVAEQENRRRQAVARAEARRAPAQQENRQGHVARPAADAQRQQVVHQANRQGQDVVLAPRAPAQDQVAQPAAPAPAPNLQIEWNLNAPVVIPNQLMPHERLVQLLPRGPLFILSQPLFPAVWIFDNIDQIHAQMRSAVRSYQRFPQPAPWMQGEMFRRRPRCCGFCYGTAKEYAESHNLRVPDKDSWGPWSLHLCKAGSKCTCPVLKQFVRCDICNAQGDNAHTTAHHLLKLAENNPAFQ